MLTAAGYQEVSKVERDGEHVKAEAKRDGKDVELRVSRLDQGTSPVAGTMSESDVKERLEKAGYSEVSEVKQEAGQWKAKAKRAGNDVRVHVDADRQALIEERERS